jgi:hypothetical protein
MGISERESQPCRQVKLTDHPLFKQLTQCANATLLRASLMEGRISAKRLCTNIRLLSQKAMIEAGIQLK